MECVLAIVGPFTGLHCAWWWGAESGRYFEERGTVSGPDCSHPLVLCVSTCQTGHHLEFPHYECCSLFL